MTREIITFRYWVDRVERYYEKFLRRQTDKIEEGPGSATCIGRGAGSKKTINNNGLK